MIYIDTQSKAPVYIQLYEAIKKDILSEAYPQGTYLPPIRKLAADLCVSKNTVDNAYQQLAVEGYIRSCPGAGHMVLDIGEQAALYASSAVQVRHDFTKAAACCITPAVDIDFKYGDLSPEFFPSDYWRRASAALFSSYEASAMSAYDDARGFEGLRTALASYVLEHRGIRCSPDQIIICSGFVHSISIVCELLADKCHCLGMEDPGFFSAKDMFRYKGFNVSLLHHYPENTYFDDLAASQADCLYVTPSHQFPMGKVMPVDVRYRILKWASDNHGYIIEDDYDSQLRYHSRPVPSLYSLCNDDRVIYIGTFSKSLSPAMRISYLILPPQLAESYNKLPSGRHSYVSWLDQRILAGFIEDGTFAKHLRRMNTVCCARHDLMHSILSEKFCGKVEVLGLNAGLHMIVRMLDGSSSDELMRRAEEAGVRIYSVKEYFADADSAPDDLFLIGFGKVSESEIERGLDRLFEVFSC